MVTIIVLIILAAVTINLLFGTNGIITRTQEGAENYKKVEQGEIEGLIALENEIDDLTTGLQGGGTDTTPKLLDGFTHIEGNEDEGYVIKHNIENSEFVWVPVKTPVLEVPEGTTESEIRELIDAQIDIRKLSNVNKNNGKYKL